MGLFRYGASEQLVLAQKLPEGPSVLFRRARGMRDVTSMGSQKCLEKIVLKSVNRV